MSHGFTMSCDRCDAVLMIPDGTQLDVAVSFRKAGWTSPGPFSDRCPTCSASPSDNKE